MNETELDLETTAFIEGEEEPSVDFSVVSVLLEGAAMGVLVKTFPFLQFGGLVTSVLSLQLREYNSVRKQSSF